MAIESSAKRAQRIQLAQVKHANADANLTVKPDELLNFTQRLKEFYSTGVNITESLNMIHKSVPNEAFQHAILQMKTDIENGQLLSEAMARFPNVFTSDYISMIVAAEKSGRFTKRREAYGESQDGILEMLINYMKRKNTARQRVKSGLLYPLFIAIAIVGALGAFGFYVLPAIKTLFEALNMKPESMGILTRFMLGFADIAQGYWWVFPIAMTGIILAIKSFFASETGKDLWHKYQLRLKFIGPLFQHITLAEITSLMSTLFSAGLTPQEILVITKEATVNREVSNALTRARNELYNGKSFSDALRDCHPIFEGYTHLVFTGAQKAGTLSSSLQDFSVQLFEKVDYELDRLIRSIEPIMLVIAGIAVGLIAISYYGGLSSAIGNLATGH